ncbi:hypothetical protein ANN_21755, partial [Periplaneta americana]
VTTETDKSHLKTFEIKILRKKYGTLRMTNKNMITNLSNIQITIITIISCKKKNNEIETEGEMEDWAAQSSLDVDKDIKKLVGDQQGQTVM